MPKPARTKPYYFRCIQKSRNIAPGQIEYLIPNRHACVPPLPMVFIKTERQILQRKISLRIVRRLHPALLPHLKIALAKRRKYPAL
jgi:hypothetical protein